MKARWFLFTVILCLTGCSLIWNPTATVKNYLAAAQKGDVEMMTQLFSARAIQKQGLETIRANNKNFAEMAQRASAASGSYRMESLTETSTPEGKRVSFFYKSDHGPDSIRLVFDLSKEGQAWKIDNIGNGEPAGITNSGVPTTNEPMLTETPPSPPAPGAQEESKSGSGPKTISGGVLNGKAISLPKPPYPPIAKAAKASGTVVVKVLVDENGNVVSASAISGHPLLQAAAVAAARGAKFPPTKLNGEPAKLSGVLNYVFNPE